VDLKQLIFHFMADELNNGFSLTDDGNEQDFISDKDQDSIWLSVSEAAKLGGVQDKTIRRAIKANTIRYKVVKNRYQISLYSLLIYLHQTTKLKNKLKQNGLGRYVDKWDL